MIEASKQANKMANKESKEWKRLRAVWVPLDCLFFHFVLLLVEHVFLAWAQEELNQVGRSKGLDVCWAFKNVTTEKVLYSALL